MSKEYLFPDFLDRPEAYEEARAFWRSLCEVVLARNRQEDEWQTFPEELSAPGTPVRDGNPIHALINHARLKSVVIIQQDPRVHSKWEMAAWVNLFGDELSEPGPVNELVFTCNVTQKTAATFEKLFEEWIRPGCDAQTMRERIKELIDCDS